MGGGGATPHAVSFLSVIELRNTALVFPMIYVFVGSYKIYDVPNSTVLHSTVFHST